MRHGGGFGTQGPGSARAWVPAVPAGLRSRLAASGWGDIVARWWRAEREARRPFLWLPVALGAGVLLYFAAETEPAPWAAWPGIVAGAALAVRLRSSRPVGAALCLGAAVLCLGFALAQMRTTRVAAPVLAGPLSGSLTGWVETVEARPGGGRLMVRIQALAGAPPESTPARVRLVTALRPTVRAGDFIAAQVRLLPPPQASRPGGYDFSRDAYFQGVGAVGSINGAIRLAPEPPEGPSLGLSLAAAVDRARNTLTERIISVIGGPEGAVAASLVTGKRGFIPEATNDDLRAAGLYHVVSISGLHMVLAAGMVFWIVRAAGALLPDVVLKRDLRKAAALAAMAAGCAYNLFAGAEIATQRSLVMTLALFGAMLADRAALSMRNLALTALLVLAIEPESLLGPSFQMSFGAVAALIALYERPGAPGIDPEAGPLSPLAPGRPPSATHGPLTRGARWLALVLWADILTTLAAEAATAPFALYHFQRLTPYGVIGNALTLPLVSLVVMPMAMLGALLWPFGLDAPAWMVMGLGIDGMLRLSALVAGLPGSTQAFHAIGAPAALVLSLALLWGTLWISPLRWLALPLVLAGFTLAWREPRPDIVIARDGRTAAVRQSDGRLAVTGKGPGGFVLEQWLRADGDLRPAQDPSLIGAARCDPSACLAPLPDGAWVSVVSQPAAFEEDCRRARVIVTPLRAPASCAAALVVDRTVLESRGALTVRFAPDGPVLTTDRTARLDRPWSPRKEPPRPTDRAADPPVEAWTMP